MCGRRKIRSDIKRIKWRNGDVEDAVRKKKGVYKRWIQVETSESRDEYLRAKREARDAVRKAKNEEWVNHFKMTSVRTKEILGKGKNECEGKTRSGKSM